MITGQKIQIEFNDKVVRQFMLASLIWGVVGMLVGVLIATQLNFWQANFGQAWLSWMVGDTVGALLAGVPLVAWTRHGAARAFLGREGAGNLVLRAATTLQPATGDIVADDGGSLKVGDTTFKFYVSPGHTPGALKVAASPETHSAAPSEVATRGWRRTVGEPATHPPATLTAYPLPPKGKAVSSRTTR